MAKLAAVPKARSFIVIGRCWLGFNDAFPFRDFNHLTDEGAERAMRHALAVQVWNQRQAIVRKRKSDYIERFLASRKQSKEIRGQFTATTRKRQNAPSRQRRRYGAGGGDRLNRYITLAAEIGWRSRGVGLLHDGLRSRIYSPRVLLAIVDSEDLGNVIVTQLSELPHNNKSEAEERSLLNPRFSAHSADVPSMGEHAAMQAAADRMRTGDDSSGWSKVFRPYLAAADSILETWRRLNPAQSMECGAGQDHTKPTVVTPRPKRSTEKGDGRVKLIAAITMHHQYADGGCQNLEPVGNNQLARLAKVSESTASAFFKREFNSGKSGGHSKYRAVCGDKTRLVAALKLLNQEYSPHHLFGAKPPGEDGRDDEE